MEESKEIGYYRKPMIHKDSNSYIKLHCPTQIGDPKMDALIQSLYNRMYHMRFTELAELPMYKNNKDIHQDALAEAQKMSYLRYRNYFGINGITFIINYRTEVYLK